MKNLLLSLIACLSISTLFGQIGIEARPQKSFAKMLSESPKELLVNWEKQPWEKLFEFYADPSIGENYPALKEGFVIFVTAQISREGKVLYETEAQAKTSFPGNILFPGTIFFPGNILFPGTILDQWGHGEFQLTLNCRMENAKLNKTLKVSGKNSFSFEL